MTFYHVIFEANPQGEKSYETNTKSGIKSLKMAITIAVTN